MRALLLDSKPQLVSDYPAPRHGPGEALVRVHVAGICDTDLQLARGYMGHRGVLGHEFVGTVVEAEQAEWIGRRVVADINVACGHCPDCAHADGHHCATRTVLGIAGRDGALAEQLVVPERNLVKVADDLSDDHAVFAEPLAAALHVLDEIDRDSSEPVTVLGDGKLGLLVALVLADAGVPTRLIGHHQEKLKVAAQAGVSTLLEADLSEGSARPRVVVEATGSSAGLARALRLVKPRGTVILKTTIADSMQLNLAPVVINEIKLVGSRCGYLWRSVRLLAQGDVDPTPLIAARYPLSRADEALRHAAQPGVLKVLVDVDA